MSDPWLGVYWKEFDWPSFATLAAGLTAVFAALVVGVGAPSRQRLDMIGHGALGISPLGPAMTAKRFSRQPAPAQLDAAAATDSGILLLLIALPRLALGGRFQAGWSTWHRRLTGAHI